MTHDDRSDEQLVRAFHGGDALAFSSLMQRHQDAIYRICSSWLFDRQRAEDAAQEVFLRAYRQLPRFRFRAEPFTWLYRTTRLVCYEFNRQVEHAALEAEHEAHDNLQEKRRDALEELTMAMKQLPARQREVITLRYLEERSVKETARLMGCRVGTVKALTHKARATLAQWRNL